MSNLYVQRVDEHCWIAHCRLCRSKKMFKSEVKARKYWPYHAKSAKHQRHFTAQGAADREARKEQEDLLDRIFGAGKS